MSVESRIGGNVVDDVRERIDLANEKMTIGAACRFIGMEMGDFDISSVKTYCPFGELMHDDGGRSKAFRVYPATNSAYCFACVKAYRPVSLIAADRDVPEPIAADIILEEVGFIAPDFISQWDALTVTKPAADTDSMANALKIACARMVPNWEERQFDDDVAPTLRACVAAAAKVTNEDEARDWLDITKVVMSRVLGVASAL